MNANNRFLKRATKIVMQDLVDCLVAENFLEDISSQIRTLAQWNNSVSDYPNLHTSALFLQPFSKKTYIWEIQTAAAETCIVIALAPAIAQEWQKVADTQVYLITKKPEDFASHIIALEPVMLMEHIFQLLADVYQHKKAGIQLFMNTLKESVIQMEWSLKHRIEHHNLFHKSPAVFFQTMEQWGALRDRPYHPLAKAKIGLNEQDYKGYLAEFSEKIPLCWVAIDNQKLMLGQGIVDLKAHQPMHYFLSIVEQASLTQELIYLKIADHYTAIVNLIQI